MSFWETMEMLSGENRRAKRAGLLAQQYTAPQLIEPDGPGLIGEPAAGIQPAGLMNPSQMQQYATGLIGIGGNPGQLGGALLQQQQAADLQQRQWMQQQLYNRQLNQQMGVPAGYSDVNQFQTQMASIRDDYLKDTAPEFTALQYYRDATQQVLDAGGVDNVSGQRGLSLMTAWFKMRNPNEAMQVDDRQAAIEAGGMLGMGEKLINDILKGGKVPDTYVKQMMNGMASLKGRRVRDMENKTRYWSGQFTNARGNPRNYIRPPIQFNQQGQPVPYANEFPLETTGGNTQTQKYSTPPARRDATAEDLGL